MSWFMKPESEEEYTALIGPFFFIGAARHASRKDNHGGNRTTGSISATVHRYVFVCGNFYGVCVCLSNWNDNLLGRLIEVERSFVTVVYLLWFVKELVVIKRFPQ